MPVQVLCAQKSFAVFFYKVLSVVFKLPLLQNLIISGIILTDNDDDEDDNDICADNTMTTAISAVVGAVALIAIIFLLQFIR